MDNIVGIDKEKSDVLAVAKELRRLSDAIYAGEQVELVAVYFEERGGHSPTASQSVSSEMAHYALQTALRVRLERMEIGE